METKILKDDALKNSILSKVKNEILTLHKKYNKVPGIAFIGFLGVPLGKYNIPFHINLASELGFNVYKEIPDDNITEEELFKVIGKLNNDNDVHAIVLLQPLPDHLNPLRIINKIDPEKEVEGFHPQNMMSTLFPDVWKNKYQMCLPTALSELMKSNDILPQKDKEWVILLDDEFFSNPLVSMVTRTAFIKAVPDDCTSIFVNKDSAMLVEYCKRADVLVVVTKHPEYIQPEWLKPGVFIIDIYSNLLKEVPAKKDPSRMVPVIRGGVNVEAVENIAGAIIPIPGGLMSVVLAMLFRNAMISFRNSL